MRVYSVAAALALAGLIAPVAPIAGETVAQQQVACSGVLVSETGQPIAGAAVQLNGIAAETDGAGNFRVALPDDTALYTVSFTRDGYYDARYVFSRSEIAAGLAARPVMVARKPDRRLLVFAGDVMSGRRYEDPPEGERRLIFDATRQRDTRALLAEMAPVLRSADLASVNLEVTLSSRTLTEHPPKSVTFYGNPALAEALKWAGVDYVAQGNNHVYDFLDTGLKDTLAAVDAAGLAHSGAGMDAASAVRPWRTTIDGAPWSFLSFVGWKGKVTPNQVAEPGKGGAAFGDDGTIVKAVRAEAEAGRTVVLQYHGSTEYSREPTAISERRMRAAIDAGAALVIAHHPHVLQGFELYRGKLIAHSLGNFLFDQTFPETQATMLLKVWMDGDRFARAEIVPVDERDYRPVPAVGGMREAVLRRLRALSSEHGLAIGEAGGHGVLTPPGEAGPVPAPRTVSITAPAGASAVAIPPALAAAGWPMRATDAAGASLTFGRSLLWRGDFESTEGFGASDRTWAIEGGAARLDSNARHGDFALGVVPAAEAVTIENKVPLRDFTWSPMTIVGAIRGDGDKLTVQYQYLSKDKKADGAWRDAGTIEAAAGGWTPFSFDMPKAGAEPSGFRVRLVVRAVRSARPTPFAIDDLAIVNWEPADPADRAPPGFRAYVRLPSGSDRRITLTTADWRQAPEVR
ncbi:MAG: CapA family protein [Sphingomonas sp.]